MFMSKVLIVSSYCAATAYGVATIQGSCTSGDTGLSWLASQLSAPSIISCLGSPLQQFNAGRYWGTQYGKNASVVVFPATS